MAPRRSRAGLLLMAAPLYGGPLLAGWMRAPCLMPATLAAMFFLAQLFSGRSAARAGMPLVLYLAVLALTQALVVLAIYAAGAGLSTLTGVLPLPLWLPLALTALGASLYALRTPHEPRQDETITLLDQALAEIGDGASFDDDEADSTADPDVRAAVQQAVKALWALPPDAEPAELDQQIDRLERQVGHRAVADLTGAIHQGFPQVDRAFLRYLARPALRHHLIAERIDLRPAFALLLNSDDPGVQDDLVALVQALLEQDAPVSTLPPPEALRARAEEVAALAPLVAPVDRAARKDA